MFHRFYCYAQHHRESTHTSYLDQILKELCQIFCLALGLLPKQAHHYRKGLLCCQPFEGSNVQLNDQGGSALWGLDTVMIRNCLSDYSNCGKNPDVYSGAFV